MPPDSCRVFVSHRTRDVPTAERLVDVLRTALQLNDREVLFTGQVTTSMAPGEDVAARLRRELAESLVTVGLVTDATYGSAYQMMELGAAWLRDRLIVTVTNGRDLARLPAPLNEEQSVRLDHRSHVIRLVEKVGELVGKPALPPASYEAQLRNLIARTRGADRAWRTFRTTRRIAATVFLGFLIASYMFARQNIFGQVYTAGERVPIHGAKVFVGNEKSGVATDANGWFSFTVWSALPMRHRLKLELPNEKTHFPAQWTGPWPLQGFWLNHPVEFFYDQDPSKPVDKRFFVHQRPNPFVERLHAFAGSIARALEPGVVAKSSESSSVEAVGLFIDRVDTPQGYGLAFLGPKRAYFKVFVNGRELPERELLAPSPGLLAGTNYFPVQSNLRSWIPVTEDSAEYRNLFCRLPAWVVSVVDANNRVVLAQPVDITMVSDAGKTMGRFTLAPGRPLPIGQRVTLRDGGEKKGAAAALHVRAVVQGR